MLDVPVHSFDPFAGAERPDLPHVGRGGFAGAIGLLHAQAELPINFLKPREPKPVRDPNQRRMAFGVALAAAVLIGVFVYCYTKFSALDRDVAAQMRRNAEYDQQLSSLEEEAKKFKALNDWDRRGVVALDEMYDVAVALPNPSTIQLIEFKVMPRDDTKDKHVARMTLEGIMAQNPKQANVLLDGLTTTNPYRRLDSFKSEENRFGLGQFAGFNLKFTSTVDVEKLPPDKYVGRLPEVRRDQVDGGADQ
jgi:hypothetical protein